MGYLAVLSVTFVVTLVINAVALASLSLHLVGTIPNWVLFGALLGAYFEASGAGHLYEEGWFCARD